MEDIYREYVVRKAELKTYSPNNSRTCFECDLEDRSGKTVSFQLTIKGCVGSPGYMDQYKLVEPHFKIGSLIQCATVYVRRAGCFTLAMYDFMVLRPRNYATGETIDTDLYFNPSRGFWTTSLPASDRVHLPGIIEFYGDCHIPVLDEGPLPLMSRNDHPEEGLRWDVRPSVFERIVKALFGWQSKSVTAN